MEQPIRIQIGFNKNIRVKKNGEYRTVYINQNVFQNGQLDTSKSRSVWLQWKETVELRNAINSIEEQLCSEVSWF